MVTTYGQEVAPETLDASLTRLGGQVFRLLPAREEEEDWIKPLETIIVELSGMSSLLPNQEKLFTLVCKLEGMRVAGEEMEFLLFRRSVFEACSLITDIKRNVN